MCDLTDPSMPDLLFLAEMNTVTPRCLRVYVSALPEPRDLSASLGVAPQHAPPQAQQPPSPSAPHEPPRPWPPAHQHFPEYAAIAAAPQPGERQTTATMTTQVSQGASAMMPHAAGAPFQKPRQQAAPQPEDPAGTTRTEVPVPFQVEAHTQPPSGPPAPQPPWTQAPRTMASQRAPATLAAPQPGLPGPQRLSASHSVAPQHAAPYARQPPPPPAPRDRPMHQHQPVYQQQPMHQHQPLYEQPPVYQEQTMHEHLPVCQQQPPHQQQPPYQQLPPQQLPPPAVAARALAAAAASPLPPPPPPPLRPSVLAPAAAAAGTHVGQPPPPPALHEQPRPWPPAYQQAPPYQQRPYHQHLAHPHQPPYQQQPGHHPQPVHHQPTHQQRPYQPMQLSPLSPPPADAQEVAFWAQNYQEPPPEDLALMPLLPSDFLPPYKYDQEQMAWWCNLCHKYVTTDHIRSRKHVGRRSGAPWYLRPQPEQGAPRAFP